MVYSVHTNFGGRQTSAFFDGTKSCSPNCGTGNSLGASETRWRGRFVPVSFKPNASVFKNEECRGINIVIVDRARFQPLLTGIEIAVALHSLFATDWKIDSYLRLLVNSDSLDRLKRGQTAEEMIRSWNAPLATFRRIRERALLY